MKRHTIYLLMAGAQVFMSATYLMAKIALQAWPPLTLGLLRFAVSGLALLLLVRWFLPQQRIAPEDRRGFFWLALIAVPLNQGIFLVAMQYASAAHGALLYATTPLMVLALSLAFLGERLSWPKFGGIVLGFAGVLLILLERGLHFTAELVRGDLLLLVAVLAWAVYTILNKRMVKRYPPLFVTAQSLFWGFLLYLPLGVPAALHPGGGPVAMRHVLALVYMALVTSVFGYGMWSWGLSRLEASKVSVFSNLQPILAALQGWLFLHESLTWQLGVGMAVVLAGVVLTEAG
jgi:drug/metabolite transporter (DMT)-like permease